MGMSVGLKCQLFASYPRRIEKEPSGRVMTISTEGHDHRPQARVRGTTPSEQKFLDALIRPMRPTELALKLGVSRARIHQIIKNLLDKELIKISEKRSTFCFVSKSADTTILLNSLQSRVLSAMHDNEIFLSSSLHSVVGIRDHELVTIINDLLRLELITKTDHFSGRDAWTLTAQGRSHPQRRAVAKKSRPAPTGVRSARSSNVLSLLAEVGPMRGKDISERLNLDKTSMNAFMQYLKRKGWVRKAGADLMAPYELTEVGLRVFERLNDRGAQ